MKEKKKHALILQEMMVKEEPITRTQVQHLLGKLRPEIKLVQKS